MKRRNIIVLGCAAVAVASSSAGTANARAARAATPTVRTVFTGIDGTIAAASAGAKRLIVVGKDDHNAQAGAASYALVDTVGDRVVARGSVGHAIDLAAIDRAHGRAYLLTDVATTDAQYRTSYSLPLWTLDLRTGRVLSHRSILSGTQAEVPDALGVDEATGDLVLAAHVLYQTNRAEVIQVDPATRETQTQALPAAASAIMVDGAARRVVVSSTIGAYPATTTLTAFQTRSLQQSWTRAYTYSLTASMMDDRAHRVWVVAPGGRVMALDMATGREAAQMRLGYVRAGTFDQRGIALDSGHSAAYIVWQEAMAAPATSIAPMSGVASVGPSRPMTARRRGPSCWATTPPARPS